jgi:cell division protein FtsQ
VSGLVRAEALFRARRRRERRRTARPLLALAIATTVAGGAVWTAYASPLLRLQTVTVKGTSRLSQEQVLAAAAVRTGGTLLDVPLGAVRHRVAALAPVARVTVDRSWPHTLVIYVTGRTAVAAVATGGGADAGAVLLDATGKAFAAADSSPPGLLDLRVAVPAIGSTSPAAASALAVWAGLPPGVRGQVAWMSASSPDAVSFRLRRGATVVWGSATDGADKLAVLASLLRSPASTYDVSTPSVAVTR